jgi:hypothetical protein
LSAYRSPAGFGLYYLFEICGNTCRRRASARSARRTLYGNDLALVFGFLAFELIPPRRSCWRCLSISDLNWLMVSSFSITTRTLQPVSSDADPVAFEAQIQGTVRHARVLSDGS